MRVDLGPLAIGGGGHLLVRRALRDHPEIEVVGTHPSLAIDLSAWARSQGVRCVGFRLSGSAPGRWSGAERTSTAVVDRPPARWGLAARGATIEPGVHDFYFPLDHKMAVWSDTAARLYARAAAAQWDPAALPWDAPQDHPEEVEDAVVQVMTYLVENETAALLVPARFLAQIHPHFREVMQLLSIQIADEARHIEVFTRRMRLRRATPGLSTAGGQASLATLFREPDFAIASFLLSVLGEGSFLALLWFLAEHAPDAATRAVARVAAQDEARHVAFGMAHLGEHLTLDPGLRVRLTNAVAARHAALAQTAGLNEEVYDALLLLAAGGWEPARIASGAARVARLVVDMDEGRQQRLRLLGFDAAEAEALSSLHTRNFM